MRGVQDVEAYLGKLNRQFSPVDDQPGTYLLPSATENMPPIAMRVEPPLVVLRVHVGEVHDGNPTELFRTLLQLNAKNQVHASFGLEGDRIVLTAAMELENLDYNELEAALDEVDLTLAQQVPRLREISRKSEPRGA
jgi:hypothetical protein